MKINTVIWNGGTQIKVYHINNSGFDLPNKPSDRKLVFYSLVSSASSQLEFM